MYLIFKYVIVTRRKMYSFYGIDPYRADYFRSCPVSNTENPSLGIFFIECERENYIT